ncbi:MAG: hypothetical protein ACLUI5_08110 [Fusicatenibacter saccharivorans]
MLKIYSEAIEKAFLDSAEQIVNAQELEELLKQRILYQNKFFTADCGRRHRLCSDSDRGQPLFTEI